MFQAVTAGLLGLAVSYGLVRLFNAAAVIDRAGPSPAPLAGAAATVAVALVAAWMPARRASRTDPIAIIREA
jgi:ABC-type antimicrobial peptide transport system permease subunit